MNILTHFAKSGGGRLSINSRNGYIMVSLSMRMCKYIIISLRMNSNSLESRVYAINSEGIGNVRNSGEKFCKFADFTISRLLQR